MKAIVHTLPAIVHFLGFLALPITKPQRDHLQRLLDGLCTSPEAKTLAALQRQFLEAPDASNTADFLRQSPWDDDDLDQRRRRFVIDDLLRRGHTEGQPLTLTATLDDSTTRKDKGTSALEAVDWTFDHAQHRNVKGAVHVALRLHVGRFSYSFSWRLYLRAKTVRRLNKERAGAERLRFRSKLSLAREMLTELQSYLPRDAAVYVLFDRWYASAHLIRFIRRRGWHVICAVKSNRLLSGTKLSDCDKRQRNLWYSKVSIALAGKRRVCYYVRQTGGRLKQVSGRVRVVISRRHNRDKYPKYFLSTDTTLSASEILTWYAQRWPQEVDFWYLKQRLGLGDFRVHGYEAIAKWYGVQYLTLTFLTWRLYEGQSVGATWSGVADVLVDIRAWHARDVLTTACAEVLASGDMTLVLRRFLAEPAQREAG